MKTSTLLSSGGLVVVALLFTGSFLAAQSTSTNTATKRKSGSVVVVGPKVEGTQHSNTVTNPLYQPHGNSGENPLYEGKNKTISKPTTGTPTAQAYKDPEDMTTRYRPGNNKTTRTAGSGNASKPDGSSVKQ